MLNEFFEMNDISLSATTIVKIAYNYLVKLFVLILQSIPVLIIFTFIVILIEARSIAVFTSYLGPPDKTSFFAMGFFIFYSFLGFFLLPWAFAKIIYKYNLKDLCVTLPQRNMKTVYLIILALLFVIPWGIYFAHQPAFQDYSFGQIGTTKFIFMHLTLIPLYYVVEEFFFRGFLFNIFWKKVKWNSFWITDIIFTISHIGKPLPEIILCIPVSIILNYLTLKTKSIYPAVFVHSSLGILLNTLITFKFVTV